MECKNEKKILGKIFSHRCAFIVLIYNKSLIAITQTIIIVWKSEKNTKIHVSFK